MALRIVKKTDPIKIDRLNIVLYGPPGIGKTSCAFTASAPILLDFDHGVHRAENRGDSVPIEQWGDVEDLTDKAIAEYDTVIVDTVGRALDCLTLDIIRRNPKLGSKSGALSLQGYGALKTEFVSWLRKINSMGKDVILLAHMDEQRNGDEIIERLDVQGGSKGEVYKVADAMGRLSIRGDKRWLSFNPTDASYGKNPGRLDALEFSHPNEVPDFMADVIQLIKGRLNEASVAQLQAREAMQKWTERINAMKTVDDFNEAIGDVRNADPAIIRLYADAAKAAGLVVDKAAGKYVAPATEQKAAA